MIAWWGSFGRSCGGAHCAARSIALPASPMSLPTPLTVLQPASRQASARARAMRVALLVMACLLSGNCADIDEMAVHCGSGGHRVADEMGAAPGALAALEVPVAGAGAALAGLQAVGVPRQAHG